MCERVSESVCEMIYSLSVFNRKGVCVFYWEWNKPPSEAQKVAEDQHLLYGMLYSMKLFVAQMAPPEAAATGEPTRLQCFCTDSYALHYFESATGTKFVAITDPTVDDLSKHLETLYREVYVEYVVKNPYLLIDDTAPITCSKFVAHAQMFIEGLPCFSSKPAPAAASPQRT